MEQLILLLGSNIEPRTQYLEQARHALRLSVGELQLQSSIYESAAWGFESSQAFLNQVVMMETVMFPESVLDRIQDIEESMGRQRKSGGYASRTIDIDILYFGNQVIQSERLVIPHPRLHERRFTLIPLVEIAEQLIHPVFGKDQKSLLEACGDAGEVWKYHEP